ncbi:serine hydrolase domain-containing protein [Alkalimonas collagenimarina]|uniref:Serine hydrolase domain-containing protein n=1 Tax=Alkalimonas collagenimarina TaxID=400390 RepID=A0ABT9GZ40_9GAMM|nr:serine hydrolase domain-containing protein [Alkalimonas collagenimarina]MDP4536327.1 serine hydrolase domain-containing protein [Alkalimonas collagenimarina]
MKKYLLVILAVSAHCAQATNIAPDKSVVNKEINTAALQAAVEAGLRPPVKFAQEQVNTFTVTERLSHHKVPGISFALIQNGEVSWAQGYGTIAASSDQAVTVNTVFQAASIAKPVTVFAVMRMKDQGVIDIHADIETYVTSLTLAQGKQTAETPVTFKNILDHTSGLTAGGYLGYEKGAAIPSDVQTFNGEAPATNKAAKVETTPGTLVSYSGAGYTLAEIALSDTFQQPFEQVMDAWVLSQVGMENSSFAMDYPQKDGVQAALGHEPSGKPITGGWRVHPEQAAAGLWSTPSDLAKLAIETTKAYQGQSELLSQASSREMLAPVMPDQDLSDQFGGQPAMTFIVAGDDEQFLFKHGGGTRGYSCFMVMYPETGDGAVFMTNSDAGFSIGLEMLRAASFVYNWPDFKGKPFERRTVNRQDQTVFLGKYPFVAGWQADVIQLDQADGIAVKFPNGDVYPLTAVQGDHAYVHEDTGVEVSFSLSAGKPKILLYNQTAYKKQ